MVSSRSIDQVVEYAVCPAKAFLKYTHPERPAKQVILDNLRLGLNDVTIRNLDSQEIDQDDIARVVKSIYKGITYDGMEQDQESTAAILSNLSPMLKDHEMVVTGSAFAVEAAYGGRIITGAVDMVLKSLKRGYIHPAVVDFSRTKYEPFYNPVTYRCQLVADYMEMKVSSTRILVFGLANQKVWEYEHSRYGPILTAAITEMTEAMEQDLWPVRFGWWCAGCTYRGICHRLLDKRVRRVANVL